MSESSLHPVPRSRATMRDVAALAGVSLKTVSRVVNRETGVSTDLEAKVGRAIEQLDYRHNLAASNLRRTSSRTGVVGALLQDIGNSFSSSLLRALEDIAHDRDTAVLAASLDEEPARETQLVRDLVGRRVDGLVLMPATPNQEYLLAEMRAGLPVVFVDRRPVGIQADCVTVDNRAGGRAATRHLVEVGHRRIAVLSDLGVIETAAMRIAGYRDAMREAGIPVEETLVRADLRGSEAGSAAVRDLLALPDPPTAIFSTRNVLSTGAFRALRSLGRQHDVALVGFDDFESAELLDPPLTVVRQDVDRIGAEVGRLLFRRIEGSVEPAAHTVVAHSLVPRGSGEITPPGR